LSALIEKNLYYLNMLKRIQSLIFISFTLLSGCGGSAPADLISKYALAATATPYINAMSIAIAPAPCTSLIVPFEVTSRTLPLPSGFTPKTVSIQKNGSQIWTQAVSTTETIFVNSQSIQGVARGCSPNSISVGETLELNILVSAENSETEISTTAKLTVVY
jgi:hypothetical protein